MQDGESVKAMPGLFLAPNSGLIDKENDRK